MEEDLIELSESEELLFYLETIGIPDSYLVLEQDSKYFETPSGFFPFYSINDFQVVNGKIILKSMEDDSIFLLEEEQFAIIREFLY